MPPAMWEEKLREEKCNLPLAAHLMLEQSISLGVTGAGFATVINSPHTLSGSVHPCNVKGQVGNNQIKTERGNYEDSNREYKWIKDPKEKRWSGRGHSEKKKKSQG